MKIKIAKIERTNKHSEAKNKDYVSVVITDEKGEKYSGFGNKINERWKDGDEVEIEVKINGKYKNFELPARKSNLMEETSRKFQEIDERLKSLEDYCYKIKGLPNATSKSDEATDESENLPF